MNLLWNRLTAMWLLLVAITSVSWLLGYESETTGMRLAGVGVLVLALLKVRVVMSEFMALRTAPLAMRLAADAWVVVICAVLSVLYLQAPVV